jgi:hypothetical protein
LRHRARFTIRNASGKHGGQQTLEELRWQEKQPESGWKWKYSRQQPAEECPPNNPAGPSFSQGTPHVEQSAILDTRRADRLAGATGQTTIQVLQRSSAESIVLQQLFDQIYPTSRAIQLVTQQLIGGASCRAQSTMNATAQYLFSLRDLRQRRE